MKKLLSIIFGVLGGILLIELFVFQAVFPKATTKIRYESDVGFTCTVPDWTRRLEDKDGWHKHVFTGSGQLYVSTRKLDGDPGEWMDHYRQTYIHPRFEAEIAVFENGRFLLSTFGKGGRKYIYLFSVDELFFWVEMISSGSTLTTFKNILDETVSSISVRGREPGQDFSIRAQDINSRILKYAQPPELLAAFMVGVPLVLVLAVTGPILLFAGKLPDLKGRRPIRSDEDLFAWFRSPRGISGMVVSLALFEDRLEVYNWKKIRLVITPDSGTIHRVPGKERLVLKKDGFSIVVDLEGPVWWLGEMSARGFAVEPR